MNIKINFAEDKTYKSLMLMFLPIMAVVILNSVCSVVDRLWINKLIGGNMDASVAIINTCTASVAFMLLCIAAGISNGVSIIVSKVAGRGDDKEIESAVATTFIVYIICIAVVLILFEMFLPSILRMLRVPDIVFSGVCKYAAIYLITGIPVYIYLYFSAVMRSFGNTVIQLVGVLICTLLNAVLDPVFIKRMGQDGATAATVIAQIIGVIFIILYIKQREEFKLNIKAFDKSLAGKTIEKIIPSVLQMVIPVISISALTVLYSCVGVSAIEVNAVTGRLNQILLYPAVVFSVVLINIIGQCSGAGRIDRLKEYLKASIKVSIPVMIILSLLIILFSDKLTGLYMYNNNIAVYVRRYFMIVSIGYVLNVVTTCCLGAVNGFGKTVEGMILVIFYYMIVRIPVAVLMQKIGLGVIGIWSALLISDIAACLVTVLLVRKIINKQQDEIISGSASV